MTDGYVIKDYYIWSKKHVSEKHAFIYNSAYRNNNKPWLVGAIIDNRQNHPIFMIEEKDRE